MVIHDYPLYAASGYGKVLFPDEVGRDDVGNLLAVLIVAHVASSYVVFSFQSLHVDKGFIRRCK